MLREWKRRKGMLPVSTSTMTMSRSDSSNVDEMLYAEIDDRYSRYLATASDDKVPQRNLAHTVSMVENDDASVDIELPDECVRIISVKLSGWKRPARIIGSDTPLARIQTSRYVCAKSCDPIALQRGRRLTLYSRPSSGSILTHLICVAAPSDGSYEFDHDTFWNLKD